MKEFHPLTIERILPETTDSVRISLAVPDELRDEYRFIPGQHLPFQAIVDGVQPAEYILLPDNITVFAVLQGDPCQQSNTPEAE